MTTALPPRQRWFFAIANAVTAALIAIGAFKGLPVRYGVVDWAAAVVLLGQAASAIALVYKPEAAPKIVRSVSMITLVIGLALCALLLNTASFLSGAYGTLGKGGSFLFSMGFVLLFPYLIVLPAAQLVWIGPPTEEEEKRDAEKKKAKKASAPETKKAEAAPETKAKDAPKADASKPDQEAS